MNFNPEEAYRKASRENSRDRLIIECLPYVRKILSKLTVGLPAHVDRDGLESAGVVGLVKAANSYDPSRGVAFKTFAYPRIHGAIIDELRKNSPVSQQMLDHLGKIREALYATLSSSLARGSRSANRFELEPSTRRTRGLKVSRTAKLE